MGMNKILITFLVVALLGLGYVAATETEPTIEWVKLDGDTLDASSTNEFLNLQRGDTFEVKVRVRGADNVTWRDAQIEVTIRGVHNEDISDITDTFDLEMGSSQTEKLTLKLPDDLDTDRFKIRVRLENRNGDTISETYDIKVKADNYKTIIKDIIFNPSNNVIAGRSLLTIVRIENMGYKDEDGIKVEVAIPELGISAADYVDELDSDDSTTSEELYMRIPSCIDGGLYDVEVTVTYDDGDSEVTEMETIRIVEDETCDLAGEDDGEDTMEDQTVITVPKTQSVPVGSGVVYPVTISNHGKTARTFIMTVSGLDAWGTYSVDPGNVMVVPAKEAKTAFLYINANDDAAKGTYTFAMTVASGEESKVVTMEAVVNGAGPSDNVPTTTWSKVKKGLEIALVVLVVVLVILGLIIGFNKLRGDENEEEEEVKGQTYY